MSKPTEGKRPLSFTKQRGWQRYAAKIAKMPLAGLVMGLAVKLTVPRQRVGVALVAFNAAHELFMVRHVFHHFYEWGLPGGWLKKNEAPEAGVLRELREEIGLTAVLGPAVSVTHSTKPPHIGIAYVGQLNDGEIKLSHELSEVRWFALDNLPKPLSPHTQLAIQTAVQANWQNEKTAAVRNFG